MVAEFAEPSIETMTEKKDLGGKLVGAVSTRGTMHWKVYVDGAANQRGSGVGIV